MKRLLAMVLFVLVGAIASQMSEDYKIRILILAILSAVLGAVSAFIEARTRKAAQIPRDISFVFMMTIGNTVGTIREDYFIAEAIVALVASLIGLFIGALISVIIYPERDPLN